MSSLLQSPPLVPERDVVAGKPLRVALCGPIARPGEPAGGGYEAANRRTCDALVRRGAQVWELPYPAGVSGRTAKALAYGLHFARTALALLMRPGRYDLLHLTPLNQRFAWAEHLLMRCARLAGKPVLMDVRAGTFVRCYRGGSDGYRRIIDASLALATRVAVEGESYLEFVAPRARATPLYFPNYVSHPAACADATRPAPRPGAALRLLYVGRMVPEKGIPVLLQAARALARLGWACEIDLVGSGPPDRLAAWRFSHGDLAVTWHGALEPQALRRVVAQAHFFVFPTRHEGEGHSNALNEAMAAGVVPVCSDQGFNAQVVGPAGVVLPGSAAAIDYARAIDAVLLADRWGGLSQAARWRVATLFSEDANLPALFAIYRAMRRGPR